MNPIINHFWTPEERSRYGIRSIDEFTVEELAALQQKVEGWLRERPPHPGGTRRRTAFVMKRRNTSPADGAIS
jgi:hypothetical protein